MLGVVLRHWFLQWGEIAMVGKGGLNEAYIDCDAVRKLKEGSRRIVVLDLNGSIQQYAQPIENPPEDEITAGKEIRRRLTSHPTIASSAQTAELTTHSAVFNRSRELGYDRPAPKIRLPDGTITNRPEDVKGWEYLVSPTFDLFISFGSKTCVLKDGAFWVDRDYEIVLGGSEWYPRTEYDLLQTFGESYKDCLGRVNQDGLFKMGKIDVEKPEYRFEFHHFGPEGLPNRTKMYRSIMTAKATGAFRGTSVVDESNPRGERFTSYLVPEHGEKVKGLERAGSQLSVHSGVPMSELEVVTVDDSSTGLISGLTAFQGAAKVTHIVPCGSPLSEAIHNNMDDFAGLPLLGSPRHPELPGRYHPTDTEGVYWWYCPLFHQPRKFILADYVPKSKGLPCTQSVLVVLDSLGFK